MTSTMCERLRFVRRQVRIVDRKHEELIWIVDAVRVPAIDKMPDKVVVVRDEQRVSADSIHFDIRSEREALEFRRDIAVAETVKR